LWPFANECRAFARLAQSGFNGNIAVKSYGWMKLSSEQLQKARLLSKNNSLSPWSIVKDFIVADTTGEDLPCILRSIDTFRDVKILLQDPRLENFKGKLLVDLGTTRTYPHPFWNEFEANAFYNSTKRAISAWHSENGCLKEGRPL